MATVLTWTDPPDADLASIKVYKGASAETLALLDTVAAGVETYTDATADGSEQYYALSAVDDSGNESELTGALLIPDPTAPTAPVLGTVTAGDGTLTIEQTAASDNIGVVSGVVEWSDDDFATTTGSRAMTSGELTGDDIVITGLTNATEYSVRATVEDAAENEATSNTVTGTPEAAVVGYRYYRLNISDNNGDAQFVGVLEFELRAYDGGPSLPGTLGGTAFASGAVVGNEAAKAFDSSYATGSGWVVQNNDVWPQHIGWDFGEAVYVGQFVVSSHSTATSTDARSVKDATIEGSSDGSSWTTLLTLTGETGWTLGETRGYEMPDCPPHPTGIYEQYRWVLAANNGDGTYYGVSELGLYVTDGGSNLLSGGTMTGDFDLPLTDLTDGNTRTGALASAGAGRILRVDITTPAANPTLYKVGAHYTTTSTANRSWRDWTLQRSYDGILWENWHTPASQTGWSIDQIRTFTP